MEIIENKQVIDDIIIKEMEKLSIRDFDQENLMFDDVKNHII